MRQPITTVELAGITVCYCPISHEEGMTRRQNEQAAVRHILDRTLGKDQPLLHTAEGAPYTPGGPNISISHSRDTAVVAFCDNHPIGVDAETWRETILKIREKYLSPAELTLFTTPTQLLTAWTIKEAVYKIAGPVAVNFAEAITISADMQTASVGITTYTIHTIPHPTEHITVAVRKEK